MERTNGEGVNFILNSLSEEKLQASFRCLRRGGTFFEIGKFDIVNNSNLGMGMFAQEATFRVIFADRLADMPAESKYIFELIEKDLNNGIIQPIPSTVFAANELEKAFRYLSTGKHMGKVVIQVRENEDSVYSLPLKMVPKMVCDPNLVYIIVGGLGGFGLEFADWLVMRGAKYLVLSSRRGATTAYQFYRFK